VVISTSVKYFNIVPPEFRDSIKDIDPDNFKPEYMRKPSPTRINKKKSEKLTSYLQSFRRRKHRILRNMGYRYI
jgi:hypothetical protein